MLALNSLVYLESRLLRLPKPKKKLQNKLNVNVLLIKKLELLLIKPLKKPRKLNRLCK